MSLLSPALDRFNEDLRNGLAFNGHCRLDFWRVSDGLEFSERDILDPFQDQLSFAKELNQLFSNSKLVVLVVKLKSPASISATPFKERNDSFHLIKEGLHLLKLSPEVLYSYFRGYASFSIIDLEDRPVAAGASQRVTYCQDIFSNGFTVGWTAHTRELSTAVVFYNESDCEDTLRIFKSSLRQMSKILDQPMTLGYICCDMRFKQSWYQVEARKNDLPFLSARNGGRSRKLSATSSSEKNISTEAVASTFSMTQVAAGIMVNARRRFLQTKSDCLAMAKEVEEHGSTEKFQETSPADLQQARKLRKAFATLVHQVDSRLFALESLITITTLYLQETSNSLMRSESRVQSEIAETTVKETQISREIAELTRKDNHSMKTIALVTMVFLPGTFIASLFDVPLFDWTAKNVSNVINARLWVYFIFTVPLTLGIALLWFMLTQRGSPDTQNGQKHSQYYVSSSAATTRSSQRETQRQDSNIEATNIGRESRRTGWRSFFRKRKPETTLELGVIDGIAR